MAEPLPLASAVASQTFPATATPALPIPMRADTPAFPPQLAEILIAHTGQRVDIALKPDELGLVRMAMTLTEAGATVVVNADRPETLDLMRRHAGTLADALRALGHGSVSFAFEGNRNGPTPSQPNPNAAEAETPAPTGTPETGMRATRVVSDGLDLRL